MKKLVINKTAVQSVSEVLNVKDNESSRDIIEMMEKAISNNDLEKVKSCEAYLITNKLATVDHIVIHDMEEKIVSVDNIKEQSDGNDILTVVKFGEYYAKCLTKLKGGEDAVNCYEKFVDLAIKNPTLLESIIKPMVDEMNSGGAKDETILNIRSSIAQHLVSYYL